MQQQVEHFLTFLERAGLPKVPQEFSVVPVAQAITDKTMKEIAAFIRCFDRVTTRALWQRSVTTDDPDNLPMNHPEVCFSVPGICTFQAIGLADDRVQ
jgi:hypothetical protein